MEIEEKRKYKIIPISKRFSVGMTDLLIYSGILTAVFFAIVYPLHTGNDENGISSFRLSTTQIYLVYPLFLFVTIIYFVFIPYLMKGKTLACKMFRTRIVSFDKVDVSLVQLFKRALFHVIIPNITLLIINYMFVKEVSEGASIKELINVFEDNAQINIKVKKTTARALVLISSLLFFISHLSCIFSSRKTGVNDKISNTVIVYIDPYDEEEKKIAKEKLRMPGSISSKELEHTREMTI